MLIKKFFFSFCWVCVLCSTAQAAFPSTPGHHIMTASKTVTATTMKEPSCRP